MSDTFDHEFEAFERMQSGEYEEGPKEIKCRYCGKPGFTWKSTENGWRLQNYRGEIHKCLSTET